MLKKIVAILLVVALTATISIAGTMAYLSDTDDDVNVMTVGNVKVELNELQRNDDFTALEPFEQGREAMPIVGSYVDNKDETFNITKNENYIDKIVYATNTGKSDAYMRILIAIPEWAGDPAGSASDNNLHWNYPGDSTSAKIQKWLNDNQKVKFDENADQYTEYALKYTEDVTIDGEDYVVWSFTFNNPISAGESTNIVLTGAYLDSNVDYDADKGVYLGANGEAIDGFDGIIKIPVYVQAVQASGFEAAETALNTAFGTEANAWFANVKAPAIVDTAEALTEALAAGENVVMTEDVEMEAETTAPYGNKYGVKQDGGIFDGGNNELSIDCYGDDYGIMTSGGTIKNVTIEEGCRAVMIMYPTEDIIIDNVKIGGDGVLYPINTGEAGADGVDLIVSNSTLKGWISFSNIESASFTNVTFEQGTYYNNIYGRVLKPYVNTTLTNCSFIEHMNLDLSQLAAGQKVTFVNCTVNGQAVTADVFTVPSTDAEYDTELFTVDLPSWASTVTDCVIFK